MLSKQFHFLAPLAALFGFLFPSQLQLLKPAIVPMLMVVMLTMGLTLTPVAFKKVGKSWHALGIGLALQFSVMPLVALLLSWLFQFDANLTVGMVLLGSVAGGVASNVIAYLANGNVALSVSMTAFSTLFSILLTPLILTLLVGSKVDIPAKSMLISLLQMILLPILCGMFLKQLFSKQIDKQLHLIPELAVAVILVIIAIVLSLNADNIHPGVMVVALATLLHNILGMTLGYGLSYLLKQDKQTRRTIAIEVGMQNSAMATALALKYFAAASALPGIFFSIWLNITGSLFARWCNKQDNKPDAA